MYASNLDIQGNNRFFEPRNTTELELAGKKPTIEELGAQLADLSLIMMKHDRTGASGSRANCISGN